MKLTVSSLLNPIVYSRHIAIRMDPLTGNANFFQCKCFHCFHELIYPAQVVFCQNTHWKCSGTHLSPFPDPLEFSAVYVNERVRIQQVTSFAVVFGLFQWVLILLAGRRQSVWLVSEEIFHLEISKKSWTNVKRVYAEICCLIWTFFFLLVGTCIFQDYRKLGWLD